MKTSMPMSWLTWPAHLALAACLLSLCGQLWAENAQMPRMEISGQHIRVDFSLERVFVAGSSMRPHSSYGDGYLATGLSGIGQAGGSVSGDGQVGPIAKDNSGAITDCEAAAAIGNGSTTRPVVLATGEKWLSQPDFRSEGMQALSFSRTYRSIDRPYFTRMFGIGWHSTFDHARLEWLSGGCEYDTDAGVCIPNYAIISDEDGTQYRYVRYGNTQTYYANGVVSQTDMLQWSPSTGWGGDGGWTLARSRSVTHFSGNGFVVSITLMPAQGPSHTITIQRMGGNDERKILSVSSGGQNLQFTWTGERVTAIQEPAGGIWRYGYNSNSLLTSVTPPGASSPTHVYHYESPTVPSLLTGVTVDGVRKGTFHYYADGKTKEVVWGAGEVRDQFTYTPTITTVTNAAGSTTTYTFSQTALFGKQLTSTSRASGARCAAAYAQSTYDAATGYRTTAVDWNGHLTRYSYDSSGRLREQVSAVDTASQRTETHTYVGTDLVQTEHADHSGTAYARYQRAYYGWQHGAKNTRLQSETWTDLRTGQVRTQYR